MGLSDLANLAAIVEALATVGAVVAAWIIYRNQHGLATRVADLEVERNERDAERDRRDAERHELVTAPRLRIRSADVINDPPRGIAFGFHIDNLGDHSVSAIDVRATVGAAVIYEDRRSLARDESAPLRFIVPMDYVADPGNQRLTAPLVVTAAVGGQVVARHPPE